MYPSSSSSSSSSSSLTQTGGLTRYGSAPSSLLTSTVDAVLGAGGAAHHHHHPLPNYYSSASGGGDSSPLLKDHRSYDAPSFGGSALLRQKSSPAGFLSHLASSVNHNQNAGFTITRGGLKSQLSFTGGQESCLSQISEEEDGAQHPSYGSTNSNSNSNAATTFWDAASNSIAFSAPPPSKRSKSTNDPDFLHCLNALESQFSMPQTSLEMAAVEKLMHIPEDSVPCKIRAKRGCATHPRSIAERERRTRISGKLKKLQDLVPNMDKQTSYADMLDLAVQHIKGLQGQVQKLHKELENCTCGCKQST